VNGEYGLEQLIVPAALHHSKRTGSSGSTSTSSAVVYVDVGAVTLSSYRSRTHSAKYVHPHLM
jgi:hypothetical protein